MASSERDLDAGSSLAEEFGSVEEERDWAVVDPMTAYAIWSYTLAFVCGCEHRIQWDAAKHEFLTDNSNCKEHHASGQTTPLGKTVKSISWRRL